MRHFAKVGSAMVVTSGVIVAAESWQPSDGASPALQTKSAVFQVLLLRKKKKKKVRFLPGEM